MTLQVELTDQQLDAIAERVAQRMAPTPNNGDPWTAAELAKATRQNASTIRRAIKAGRIRRVLGTHKVLIPADEARRVIEGRS